MDGTTHERVHGPFARQVIAAPLMLSVMTSPQESFTQQGPLPLLISQNFADLGLPFVQPRMLHVNSVSDAIENVTLMYCPPDRRVKVEVPLKVGVPILQPST